MRAAGMVLIILGSLWAAVGAVLLVFLLLSSNPNALPEWVDAAASDAAALGRVALLGAVGLAAGLAQLGSGLAVQRSNGGWAPWMGLAAALFGGLVTGSWLIGGLAQGLPFVIFLPVVAAYAYAAWSFAFQRA